MLKARYARAATRGDSKKKRAARAPEESNRSENGGEAAQDDQRRRESVVMCLSPAIDPAPACVRPAQVNRPGGQKGRAHIALPASTTEKCGPY
jgi:hypothetical protein